MRKLLLLIIVSIMILSACNSNEKPPGGIELNVPTGQDIDVETTIPTSGHDITNKPPMSEESTDSESVSHISAHPIDAWIIVTNVNLRTEPSMDSEILSVLPSSQKVALIDTLDEWSLVSVNHMKGYVFAEYLSTEQYPTTESLTMEMVTTRPSQTEVPVGSPNKKNITIAIDPGHQAIGNYENEPIGPNASGTKPKVASGTKGISTQVPEYILTLDVSLKLRSELVNRGYNVFMIRETHDVNISNKERADMATNAGADIFVRIHADGSENQSVNGILMICPSSNNLYVHNLYRQSRLLSDSILTSMIAATGAKNRGILEADNMSGINWATMPVTIVEIGVMTNPEEDNWMQTDEYQQKLAKGIADGIDLWRNSSTD